VASAAVKSGAEDRIAGMDAILMGRIGTLKRDRGWNQAALVDEISHLPAGTRIQAAKAGSGQYH
jgi:hypothetical protein